MKRFVNVLMSVVLFFGIIMVDLGSTKEALAGTVAEWGNGGFLNIDYAIQAREAFSSIGSGPTGDDRMNNFYLRRHRLSFLGMANETYGYALQLEYNGGRKIGDTEVQQKASDYDLTLLDAYLTADFADALKLRAGRTKHLLTREVSEGCFDPLSIDRSVFINGPFTTNPWSKNKTTRDVGIAALGNFFSDVFQYRLAVMEGNKYSGSLHPDNIGYRYTGRVHLTLLDPESGWGYKGSYLSKKKVLTLGAGYETEPNAVFSSFDAQTNAGTGSKNYTAYTYDIFFEYPTEVGTFTASSAYLKQDFGDAGMNGVPGATGVDGEKNGYYGKLAYMLGKFQIYGRAEKWAFAELNGVNDQMVRWSAEGVNYYIKGQELRLTVEAQKIDFDKQLGPGAKNFNVIIAQLQARF